MAQTLNLNFYELVPLLEVIMNKPSAGLELITPLIHRKEEQLSTQKTYSYYKASTVNDKPMNFEKFCNSSKANLLLVGLLVRMLNIDGQLSMDVAKSHHWSCA